MATRSMSPSGQTPRSPRGKIPPVPGESEPDRKTPGPDGFPPDPASAAGKDRKHVYKVGSMRIPLRSAEIRQGPRGRFVRRLKQILHRVSAGPRKLPPDDDAYEPPRRPASPRPPSVFHGPRGPSGFQKHDYDDDDEED